MLLLNYLFFVKSHCLNVWNLSKLILLYGCLPPVIVRPELCRKRMIHFCEGAPRRYTKKRPRIFIIPGRAGNESRVVAAFQRTGWKKENRQLYFTHCSIIWIKRAHICIELKNSRKAPSQKWSLLITPDFFCVANNNYAFR